MFAIVALIISSCSSSKKFDYASAYKFRTISHHAKSNQDLENIDKVKANELYAAIENVEDEDMGRKIIESQNKILEEAGMKSPDETLSKEEIVQRVNAMDKKEKRKLRKELVSELKSEMKALKKMEKSDISSTQDTKDLTGDTRTGVILGGVGIILLILGGPVLYTLGTILVIVGVVLILVDVL